MLRPALPSGIGASWPPGVEGAQGTGICEARLRCYCPEVDGMLRAQPGFPGGFQLRAGELHLHLWGSISVCWGGGDGDAAAAHKPHLGSVQLLVPKAFISFKPCLN